MYLEINLIRNNLLITNQVSIKLFERLCAFNNININLIYMIKKLSIISTLIVLASCTSTSNGVPSAGIFTSWNDRDPISRVDNDVSSNKKGEACATNVLGIVATGDSSIETAKRDGNIRKVSFVDRTYFNVLGIYQKGCTVVKGE